MVKIRNIYGDEYRGKQRNAVYQRKYGRQIRRIKEDKKENRAPAQVEQQRRFKIGISWYKSLSYVEKEGLKLFLDQRGITLTPQQYAIKTALSRGKVSKEVFEEQVITWVYKEDWDLEGWFYRQEITLTNNTAGDLTDYQVKLELDASKVGAHFDWARMGADLRFYDEAGDKLSYYIESWDSVNKTATVWVKVGLIPGNGTAKIKMYYKNDEALSESDPNQVFEFYDDFDTFDTSKWKAGDNVPNVEEAVIFSGYTCLHWKKTAAGVGVIYSRYADLNTQNVIIESRFYPVGALDKPYGISANRWKIDSDWAMVSIHGGNYGRDKQFNVATETEAWVSPEKNLWNWNNWYIYQLVAKQDLTIGRLLTDGWGLIKEHVINDGTNINYLQMFMTRGGTGTYNLEAYVDWVRVRKYAEQEPTAEFGAEEYGLTEGLATIQVEHIIVEHPGIQNIYIIDDEGNLLKEYTGLSDVANGEIATTIDWKNDTGKTVRQVIIESISGVLNKVVL